MEWLRHSMVLPRTEWLKISSALLHIEKAKQIRNFARVLLGRVNHRDVEQRGCNEEMRFAKDEQGEAWECKGKA